MQMDYNNGRSRRAFLRAAGLGAASMTALLFDGCTVPPEQAGVDVTATPQAASARLRATGDPMSALSAREAVEALSQRRFTASRYVATQLARESELHELGALASLASENAVRLAAQIDNARVARTPLANLAGLPVLIDDNVDVPGLPTTCGTPGLRDFRPVTGAPVVQALLSHGAIVIGKATRDELGMGDAGVLYPLAHNPYLMTRGAGGAAGGCAAAVAARIVPVALAAAGVSFNVPPALCGIAALRPTVGDGAQQRRYPLVGVAPVSHTQDTVGIYARSVEDLALLDTAVTGAEAAPALPPAWIRLGVPRGFLWAGLEPQVAQAAEQALRKLRAAGITLIEVDMAEIGHVEEASQTIASFELPMDMAGYLWQSKSDRSFWSVRDEVGDARLREALRNDAGRDRARYLDAIGRQRPALIAAYASYFARNRVQGIIFPSVPFSAASVPAVVDTATRTDASGRAKLCRNALPGANAGLPSLTLPAGVLASGAPAALSIDAPVGSDVTLMSIGRTLEAVLGALPAPAV
jgi:Asp-tRNA(Asn)/Glu-tRNA(Gln) amidotransferase A subunit family amidase